MKVNPSPSQNMSNRGSRGNDPAYVTLIGCALGAIPQLILIFQNVEWVESLNPYLRSGLVLTGLGILTGAVGLTHTIYRRLNRQ